MGENNAFSSGHKKKKNQSFWFRKDFNRLFKKEMYFSSYSPFLKIKKTIKNKKKALKLENILKEKMLLKNHFKLNYSDFKNCKSQKKLKDPCLINKARKNYQLGKFEKGLKELEKIKIYGPAWPYLLREKAWFHYQLKEYRKVLGIILTYESPFLVPYKKPEDRYLETLTYYKMCLYDEAFHQTKAYLISSNHLIKKYKAKINSIKKRPNASWVRLKSEKGERSLVSDYKKRMVLSHFFLRDELMKREWQRLKKHMGLINKKNIRKKLKQMIKKNKVETLLFYQETLKKRISELKFFKKAFLNLKVELFKRKRDRVYHYGLEEISKGEKNLKVKTLTKGKDIYPFKGAFWVDELGNYQSSLKEQCTKKEGGAS